MKTNINININLNTDNAIVLSIKVLFIMHANQCILCMQINAYIHYNF